MSFADNPVLHGSFRRSTFCQQTKTLAAESVGVSFFLLKLSRLSSPFTGRVEITQHSKKNGKNSTRLAMTSAVGQHFLTMATDRVRLSSTNAPLASLARCAPVLHDQSGQLERAA